MTLTNAGLATPAMLSASHAAAVAAGTPATNPIEVDPLTQAISFNIDALAPLP